MRLSYHPDAEAELAEAAQGEPILELFKENNINRNAPTGLGELLVAATLHFNGINGR